MGAWGVGSWDNDDAGDWVYELEESKDLSLVIQTLRAITNPEEDYLESCICSEALAAAEVVAAANGRPGTDLPEEVQVWLKRAKPSINSDILNLAQHVIEIIGTRSELLELWQESDSYPEWRQAMAGLKNRLGGDSQG
jgi:hypothetical protein